MNDRQRFNVALEDQLAEWVREDAKRMNRTLNGEIVALLEKGRKIIEAREAEPEPAT